MVFSIKFYIRKKLKVFSVKKLQNPASCIFTETYFKKNKLILKTTYSKQLILKRKLVKKTNKNSTESTWRNKVKITKTVFTEGTILQMEFFLN